MYILSAQQSREWDQYTISHEPIASIDLMERASQKCAEWICAQNWQQLPFLIFCGKGNNGGDGLAIGRMLIKKGYSVSIYIIEEGHIGSPDFQTNLQRLHELTIADIYFIQSEDHFPTIPPASIVIDAIFGTGINKPVTALIAQLVEHINSSVGTVNSIDLPSGLFPDESSKEHQVIKATHTLSFENMKLAFLVQENAGYIGQLHILTIGLHNGFPALQHLTEQLVQLTDIRQVYKKRNAFSHKGNFGHALLVAGSYGKIGAAVLAAKACLHSGTGLLTCYLPRCGYTIMQSAVPEAMVLTDENENILTQLPQNIEKYSAIGIGPGIGTSEETQKLLSFISRRFHKPLVIDADGLNCLALRSELLGQLPPFTILTPHPKEFDRLFGEQTNDFERIKKAREVAKKYKLVIVLKGHHTLIAMPGGSAWFNSTGNAGMAKGGSGDVLTGMITALLAQGYDAVSAALMGVYLHGAAGDEAAARQSQASMTPSDIISNLGKAFMAMEVE